MKYKFYIYLFTFNSSLLHTNTNTYILTLLFFVEKLILNSQSIDEYVAATIIATRLQYNAVDL